MRDIKKYFKSPWEEQVNSYPISISLFIYCKFQRFSIVDIPGCTWLEWVDALLHFFGITRAQGCLNYWAWLGCLWQFFLVIYFARMQPSLSFHLKNTSLGLSIAKSAQPSARVSMIYSGKSIALQRQIYTEFDALLIHDVLKILVIWSPEQNFIAISEIF